MINASEWIDVSATISDAMAVWPTDPHVHIYKAAEIGRGTAEANVTCIYTTAHVGTHIDAPLHFFRYGMDVASIPLDYLVGPAKVFHIRDSGEISYHRISNLPIEAGDRILFRTKNSDIEWEQRDFMDDYIYLATDAAEYLVQKGIKCVGIDYLSIGGKQNGAEVHRLLLGKPVVIIEGLKLGSVPAGNYEMICLPLKIKHSDGGPARALLKPLL
jgi:arylformamidase